LIFFIFGAVVSFYHFGIEQGFFSESLICELTNNNPLNKEELLNQLKKTEIVSCKDVTFRFLGLSLATINTIISLILSGIVIKIIKNYGKN
jgi:disulfide bond formation protein DsbB